MLRALNARFRVEFGGDFSIQRLQGNGNINPALLHGNGGGLVGFERDLVGV